MSSLLLSIIVLYFGIYLFDEDARREVGTPITVSMISVLILATIGFIIGLIRFSGKAHAIEISHAMDTAKSKSSHGFLHGLKDKASHGIEMAVVRIRSASAATTDSVYVNPMHNTR